MTDSQTTACPWCRGSGSLVRKDGSGSISCAGCLGKGFFPAGHIRTEFTWSYEVPHRPPGLEEIFQTSTGSVSDAMDVVTKRGLRTDGRLSFLRNDYSFTSAYHKSLHGEPCHD